MLQVAPSFTQEKNSMTAKRSSWPELALGWLVTDGQFSMWERLPFCPSSWKSASRASSHMIRDKGDQQDQSCHGSDEMITHNSSVHSSVSFKDRAMLGSKLSELMMHAEWGAEDDTVHSLCNKGNVMMDARIWSALPEDIIEKVLAWLPLTSVLRFRAVCQRWNSVLLSGSFLTSHSKSSPHRQPCFLLCTIGKFACTFDPSLGRWLTLLKPTSPGASVVASTGSLFCLGNQVTECRVLSVCNPITRTLRQLPPMLKLRLIHKITMIKDRNTSTYKIVVAGEDGLPTPNPHIFNLITEVFDSSTNTWHMAGDPPVEAKFGSDPGVWFDGCYYCLTELPYGIVKFDVESGVWEDVGVAMPPHLTMPSLLMARNRLMMIGRYRQNPQVAMAIRLWELQGRRKDVDSSNMEDGDNDIIAIYNGHGGTEQGSAATSKGSDIRGVVQVCGEYEWVEMMEMPMTISSEFLAPLGSYSPFVCAGVGSSIFITTHLSPRVLVLDMSPSSLSLSSSSSSACATGTTTGTGTWTWLPPDPLFPKHRDFHLLGFPFEPRFDASP